ncbi:hypothetical protein [Sphingomonas nostoxanthinifaciens]|uniref:hypothetical protein n=1 Tax=Sphingomonas nostoxanthinifaciens TaxID=2872652 RepID=UPI001CC1ED8D|nr:hypothetical protein [Sphingomonas nostoxanthinifaciens]UAK24117.1 hypothetical protein K8P63_17575 [Sphingomonas nostoxanthinifaciens]
MLPLIFLIEAPAPTSLPMPSLATIVAKAVAPCRSDGRTITVCGKADGESPYRLPPPARDPGFQIEGARDSVSRERHRLMDVGGAGSQAGACSPVGGVGSTGCQVQRWRENDQQKGFQHDIGADPR